MTSWHVKKKNLLLKNLTLYYTDSKENLTQNNTSTNDYVHVNNPYPIPKVSYIPVMVQKYAV
jgi:hypothetical protein